MQAASIAAAIEPLSARIERARAGVVERGDIAGLAYSVAPERDSRFVSGNGNRVRWHGGVLDEGAFERAAERFDAHGVPLWFAWIHAGADQARVVDAAERAGLTPYTAAQVSVMVHHGGSVPPCACELAIEHESDLPPAARALLAGPVDGGVAARLAHAGELQVYTARNDDDQIVAVGTWMRMGSVAFLGWSATHEAYRQRGAHAALLRVRMLAAQRAGCRLVVSQALDLQATALANLERAGFHQAYPVALLSAGADE